VAAGTPEAIVAYAKQARQTDRRSWTGEALEEVLQAGPYQPREAWDDSADRWRKDDMEISEVGQSIKMPWESDGRRWHTQDRVGRNGEPVNWDGKILERVVDRIQEHDGFSETDWSERTVVEICGRKKSKGWFFHAITGESWLLKMKFRVRPRTFKRAELIEQIPLATANQLDDLPIYGNQPRVRLTSHRGGWQEIEIRAWTWQEINMPGFWEFLDTAIASFLDKAKRVELNIEDQTPWARLGEKWHYMRKGFAPGGKVKWSVEVLEILHGLIQETAPEGQFMWGNKQLVHVRIPQSDQPWASIQTKKTDGIWLHLHGPPETTSLGRIADFADQPSIRLEEDCEVVSMRFADTDQVNRPEVKEFLAEHLSNLLAIKA
jgi:excinuclease ABC subunit A